MRPVAIAALLVTLASAAGAATIAFVTPLPGSQALGPQLIEVTTDAAGVDRVEFSVDGTLVGVARKPPYRIAFDFGSSLAARKIAARVYSNGYRDSQTATITTAALTAAANLDVDLVEVPLRARARGQLRPDDLRVRENGRDQRVREVQPQRGAARFVFVVDRSLSMGDGRLAEALEAVDTERSLLRPDDNVSAILFNHNVAPMRAVARDEKLSALFGGTVPSGGTSLRDAIASIPEDDRTYAIVITDGGDRSSELTEEEALRKISGTRTIIDAIVLGSGNRFLGKAAKNTGGEVVAARRGEIRQRLHDLLVDINSRYLVVYQSSGSAKGWRRIDVSAKHRGVEIVNARTGYFAR